MKYWTSKTKEIKDNSYTWELFAKQQFDENHPKVNWVIEQSLIVTECVNRETHNICFLMSLYYVRYRFNEIYLPEEGPHQLQLLRCFLSIQIIKGITYVLRCCGF